jgi:cephalosporin hydroxylase
MKISIDTERNEVVIADGEAPARTLALHSPEAFAAISRQWVRVGWGQRYGYAFTWMGRPIIQLPEDMIRTQEILFRVRPDVIIETGVAHGGSLVYYASLCKLMGKGRVIGVDIEIRPHNRQAIEAHPMAPAITLIEGSSTEQATLDRVRGLIRPGETVLALLDSNHTRDHVAAELELYAPLVTPGSYLVATDGIMEDLSDVPGGKSDWTWNNPKRAAEEFAARRSDFVLEEPPPMPFNEGEIDFRVTHWPSAFLRRVK